MSNNCKRINVRKEKKHENDGKKSKSFQKLEVIQTFKTKTTAQKISFVHFMDDFFCQTSH